MPFCSLVGGACAGPPVFALSFLRMPLVQLGVGLTADTGCRASPAYIRTLPTTAFTQAPHNTLPALTKSPSQNVSGHRRLISEAATPSQAPGAGTRRALHSVLTGGVRGHSYGNRPLL